MGRLAGKTALLLGATGGIGETCAQMFSKEGARVMVAGRRAAEGEAVAKAIRDAGGDASFVQCDVTEPDSVEAAVNAAVAKFGRLDILLNNAGGSTAADGPVTTASLDEFWSKMKVDNFGVFLGCRFAVPAMQKTGGGAIINMVSMAGYGNTTGGRSGYAASKAAAMSITRTTALAFVKDGIRVNGIAPAAVGTDRIKKQIAALPEAKLALAGQPLGLIEPEDIGNAAVFLASDESRMITGHILPVHAGAFGD